MLKLLYALFPEKYQAVGDPAIRQLIRQGYQSARGYHLTDEKSIATYISLMFVLGGGFDNDPRYPWVATLLHDQSQPDPLRRGEALYKEAIVNLRKLLT